MSELDEVRAKLARAIEALEWYAERDQLESVLHQKKFAVMDKALFIRDVAARVLQEIANTESAPAQ